MYLAVQADNQTAIRLVHTAQLADHPSSPIHTCGQTSMSSRVSTVAPVPWGGQPRVGEVEKLGRGRAHPGVKVRCVVLVLPRSTTRPAGVFSPIGWSTIHQTKKGS